MTYLTRTPLSALSLPAGTSWPVAPNDPHYRMPGGVYVSLAPLYRSHIAQSQDNMTVPAGKLQDRWFRYSMPEGTFPAQEIDVHYLAGRARKAKADATIVRISGLGGNVMMDEALDAKLLENFNVISIDVPGTGLSEWPRNFEGRTFAPRDYAALIGLNGVPKSIASTMDLTRPEIALANHQLDAWGNDAPVIILGHSMGAMIALFMLTGHKSFPETVHGISAALLVNAFASDGKPYPTPWYIDVMANKLANTHEWPAFPTALSVILESVGAFAVMTYLSRNRKFSALASLVSRAMFTHLPRKGVSTDFLKERVDAQTMMARITDSSLRDEDAMRLMREVQTQIQVPVQVVLGDDDPLMFTPRMKPAFEGSVPDVSVSVVKRAGHVLFQDDPALVEKAVRELAEKIRKK